MSAPFRYYFRVRYGECDAQKVVFNARYADYLDFSLLEFLRAIGYGEAVTKGVLDYQSVKLTLEWKGSARFDQVLELSIRAKQLGNTSFTISTEFRIAGEDAVIATAETVHVCVAPETLQKMPLPADFRAALERGAPGAIVDHAGYRTSLGVPAPHR
jgi:acyl-CoA thioester hydrolase